MKRLLIDASICIDVEDGIAYRLQRQKAVTFLLNLQPVPDSREDIWSELEAQLQANLRAEQVDIISIEEEEKPSAD